MNKKNQNGTFECILVPLYKNIVIQNPPSWVYVFFLKSEMKEFHPGMRIKKFRVSTQKKKQQQINGLLSGVGRSPCRNNN